MMPWLLFLLPLASGFVAAWGPRRRPWLALWASLMLAATFALAALTEPEASSRLAWGGGLVLQAQFTPLSHLVAMLVPAVGSAILVYAALHEHEAGLRRLVALMLAFVGAMELLVMAGDLLTLLIGWELVGACSWALIGHRWREPAPGPSANFAFLATRTGDLGLFVAAMAAFAGGGSFAFDALPSLSPALLALVAGGVLVSAAAKSGQVPFAPWLFRAMDGPTSVSALLHAATMVAAGAYLLARLQPMLSPIGWFGPTAIAIGLTTALAGGVVALLQPHAKKLLAASTSAHYGLMFVAVGAGYPLVAILHLLAHGFFKASLFLAAGIAGERAGDFQLRHMHFGRVLPVTAFASLLGTLALAGVPPLGGAWTKEQVVAAAGQHGSALALAVMVAGALSAAYAARFQVLAFGRGNEDRGGYRPGTIELGALLLLGLAGVALGLLWISGAPGWLATTLNRTLPPSRTSELLLSLVLVAVGLFAGALLARRPSLGTAGPVAGAADWLGLPAAIAALVTRPALALARLALLVDEQALDAPARAATLLGRSVAVFVAGLDDAIVDRGIRLTGRLADWLAGMSGRFGERITDALPDRTADTVGWSGRQAVRLQTGLSHHYYAAIAGGIAVIVALTFVGAR